MTSAGKIKGEAFVWLNGLGLASALVMAVGLVVLIVYQGLDMFWVARVTQFEMADKQIVLGEIISERKVKRREDGKTVYKNEYHIFLGNKDITGSAFTYIDRADISGETLPEDVMVVQRVVDGNIVGWPVKVDVGDGKTVSSLDDSFYDLLSAQLEEKHTYRKKIHRLEKRDIGKINHEMELMKRKGLEDDNPDVAALQNEYEERVAEVNELRAQLDSGVFYYKIQGDGSEHSVSLGKLESYYFPNQLTYTSRTKLFFQRMWYFLTEDPREANTEGGVFPALFGTFIMTLLMCIVVTPFGVIAAVFMHEYASPQFIVRFVRVTVNNLAGVPSIVFGVFGLGFFIYVMGVKIDDMFDLHSPTFGTGGLLWASLTLALLTLPVVIVSTEEALRAVPGGMREAALALGATKWQMVYRVIIPASLPGIITGMILAMARGAGEVAPLMLVGVVKLAPELSINAISPFIHLDQKFMHLGFHIFDLGFQAPDSEAARPMVYTTALLLILVVLILNLAGIFIRQYLRDKYSRSSF